MQTCDKGNACLTCSVFVTDASHQSVLERQLAETEALINRNTTALQERHGRPMPQDNVWLLQRRAEHAALTKLLDTPRSKPGRAVQGAGCGAAPAGPVPLTSTSTVTEGPAHDRRRPRQAHPDTRHRREGQVQAKTAAAEKAISTPVKRGEPITFQPVQRAAAVSHASLYNHPDLRGRIERLWAQARPVPAPTPPADEQGTLVLALTSQITRLKKQHREEVQALWNTLEQAHGENLDLRRELARRGGDTPVPQARTIGAC